MCRNQTSNDKAHYTANVASRRYCAVATRQFVPEAIKENQWRVAKEIIQSPQLVICGIVDFR
jgi:hypothetical protein